MDTIIRTGFEKISHSIIFQPNTEPKGKALVKAGHVINVEEFRKNGRSYLVQAKVIRQTSVSSEPYTVKLNIDINRKIEDVSCTCVYSNSKKCKHIAALIYFTNNEESLSKTDVEQRWGKPSFRQLTKEKYSKGKFFFEIRKKERRSYSTNEEIDYTTIVKLKKPSPLKSICTEMMKNKDERIIQDLLSNLVKTVNENIKLEDCRVCLENFFLMTKEFTVYKAIYKLPDSLLHFYKNEIILSEEDIINLCCETLQQSKSQNWFSARRKRISASKNVHDIKCRKTRSIESLLSQMIHEKKLNTEATQYGIVNEKNARENYQLLYNVQVKQVGLMLSVSQPWLCASLDGVVIQDGAIIKIVEFKCPRSCADKPVVVESTQTCNVNYLQYKNGSIHLKESHIYYTQCQMQMYLSGQHICDLFVWSPLGNCCVPINRNETFIENVTLKCENFYFHHYLPELHRIIQPEIYKDNNNSAALQKRLFNGTDIWNQMSYSEQ